MVCVFPLFAGKRRAWSRQDPAVAHDARFWWVLVAYALRFVGAGCLRSSICGGWLLALFDL